MDLVPLVEAWLLIKQYELGLIKYKETFDHKQTNKIKVLFHGKLNSFLNSIIHHDTFIFSAVACTAVGWVLTARVTLPACNLGFIATDVCPI